MLKKQREVLVTWNSGRANISKEIMKHASAMFGLVLSGNEAVKYDPFRKTSQFMVYKKKVTSRPILENQKAYEKLFVNYLRLHGCFGTGENNVRKALAPIKFEVKHGS
jgi:L-ribulokinase